MEKYLAIGILIIFLFLPFAHASETLIESPNIDVNVTLQAQRFDGEKFGAFGGYADGPVDKYSLRHATLGITGIVGSRVEYEFRAGSATCFAGGAFTLMDAAVLYKATPFLKFGFKKGEIMRGFEFYEECVEVLTAEKPRFANTFAPCHPQGAVIEVEQNFGVHAGLSFQLAYLDGGTQNLDREHDANIGLQFRTPLPGITIGGFYSTIRKSYGPGADFEMVNDPGSRFGFGVDVQRGQFQCRSEMYQLTGYYNNPFEHTLYRDMSDSSTYIQSSDLEMNAFFVEAGYTISTSWHSLPYIQPYFRYQQWDKAANADGDHLYSYWTAGITLSLNEERSTLLRLDYEEALDCPEGEPKDASLLIVRMQVDIEWITNPGFTSKGDKR